MSGQAERLGAMCVVIGSLSGAGHVRTMTGSLGKDTYVGGVDDVGVHVEFQGTFAF